MITHNRLVNRTSQDIYFPHAWPITQGSSHNGLDKMDSHKGLPACPAKTLKYSYCVTLLGVCWLPELGFCYQAIDVLELNAAGTSAFSRLTIKFDIIPKIFLAIYYPRYVFAGETLVKMSSEISGVTPRHWSCFNIQTVFPGMEIQL